MNRSKLLAAVAVLAMVFAAFAVVSVGDESDAATDITYISGKITSTMEFDEDTTVVVNGDLTVPTGMSIISAGKFTINKDVTVTVEKGAQMVFKDLEAEGGTENKKYLPIVTINGNLVVKGDGAVLENSLTNFDKSATDKNGFFINGSVSIESGASFNGDGETIVNKDATLAVKKIGAAAGSIDGKMDICVAVGGTFAFNGKVGSDFTVSAYGSGTNTVITSAKFVPATSTDDKLKTKFCNVTFTTTSFSYTAYDKDSNKMVFKDYALNVNGSVDGGVTLQFERSVTKGDNAISDSTLFYIDKETAERAKKASSSMYIAAEPGSFVIGKVIINNLDIKEGSVLCNGSSVLNSTELKVEGSLDLAKTDGIVRTIFNYGLLNIVGSFEMDADDLKEHVGYSEKTEFGGLFINGGEATIRDWEDSGITEPVGFIGAAYLNSDGDLIMTDLQKAIDGAVAANEDKLVYVSGGYKSYYNTKEGQEECGRGFYGAYNVTADITIPDGITVQVRHGLLIADGITLTVSEDAILVGTADENGKDKNIKVDGKLVDMSFGVDSEQLVFEVKSEDANNTAYTYCSLETALKETTSGTINLYSNVTIDSDVTISSDVTVQFAEGVTGTITVGKQDKRATLTIDGVLNLAENTLEMTYDSTKGSYTGKVIVNNMIRVTITDSEDNNQIQGPLAGAGFYAELSDDDDESTYYITSVQVAAENSMKTESIIIAGVANIGDVAFTAAEDGELQIFIIGYDNDKNEYRSCEGNIKISGKTSVFLDGFSGTIGASTTAGDTTIGFDDVYLAIVGIDETEAVDGKETVMTISNLEDDHTSDAPNRHVFGTVTIESGKVVAGTEDNPRFLMTNDVVNGNICAGKLIINQGAELFVPKQTDVKLADPAIMEGGKLKYPRMDKDVEKFIADNTTFVLDGVMNVEGYVEHGVTVIGGELNVLKDGCLNLSVVKNNGTLSISEDSGAEVDVEMMSVNGKIVGEIAIEDYDEFGMVIAYPGSEIPEDCFGKNVKKTTLVLNLTTGSDGFATVYSNESIKFDTVMTYVTIENYAVEQVDEKNVYYTDATYTTEVSSADSYVGNIDTVYIKMVADDVVGKISAVSGMKIFIDNLDISNFWDSKENTYKLSVGTHTVTVQVQPGYEATPVITFNGQTVTDGKIVIEAGMEDFVLTATGDVTVDGGNGGSDSGMGITDYLLIILVVMVVILAIVVIMRMMRS